MGETELCLVLAGVGFRVRIVGAHVVGNVTARFGAFATEPSNSPEDVFVQIDVDPAWQPATVPTAVFPAAEASVLPNGGVYFVRTVDELTYDPSSGRAVGRTVGTTQSLPPVTDPTPIDTPLRQLLSYLLPRRGGLLMHASGYVDPRGAVIFIAPSGGGKTTTARKLPHAGVLSDDQVALRRTPTGWIASALPFVGEYNRAIGPQEGPLRAVVLLARAIEVSVTRLPPAAALARVLAGTVYFVRGDHGTTAILDLAADLVCRVPVYRLAITREGPVMSVLDEILA